MEYFKIFKPTIQLAPYVKHYILLKINRQSYVSQRVIPTGSTELLMYRRGYTNNIPKSFIGGYKSSFADLHPNGGEVEFISIQFQPYGAKAFLDIPIDKTYNDTVSLDNLDDKSWNELYKRTVDVSDNEKCIPIIEDFLLKKLNTSRLKHLDRMAFGVNIINAASPINVSTLADTLCLSEKQFKRVFQDYIGCNPKEFIRIVRFNKALNILKTGKLFNFAQIAQECGYSDQSHLIREFKLFSGYTPREFLTPDTGLHHFI